MRNVILIQIITLFLIGCTSNNTDTGLINQIDQLKKENEELKETINLLKYPASDREANITKLISENKFSEASKEVEDLQRLFPQSKEAEKIDDLKKIISDKQEEIKEEEAKIKALGFKALKEESNVVIGYNKISTGAFSTANTFTYDSYGDRYFYSTADRGNKYVSAKISITSSDKDPKLPVFYAYSINGDNLELINNFDLNFARWEDYGSYLGNYHDNGNDFAKTSTIAFKIGVEISDELLQKPIVILLRKENCAIRKTDRFDNPPVSYLLGDCTSAKTLSIENVRNDYAVIKILNKNKL